MYLAIREWIAHLSAQLRTRQSHLMVTIYRVQRTELTADTKPQQKNADMASMSTM